MNDEAGMKRLEINLSELAYAMEDALGLNDYYLDRETGKIVMISDETRWELEQIYEENYDPEAAEEFDLAEVLRQSNMHEWQQQMLLEADRVEQEYLSRYISIPHAPLTKAMEIWKISSSPCRISACRANYGTPAGDGAPFAVSRMCWPTIPANGSVGLSSRMN